MDLTPDQLLTMLKSQPRHERIANLRALYRLSQAGLARIAEVTRGTVSTWEAPVHGTEDGRGHEPSKMARNRMAVYFGIPGYVFTDEWGDDAVKPKRVSYKKRGEEAIIRVPAPNVKRIG